MNAKDTFLAANAHVDEAAIQPLPNSRKIYVEGSRPDIRVPMREISQADTPTGFGGEKNPPIYVYDCSGPYGDPQAKIDIRQGLPALRAGWIALALTAGFCLLCVLVPGIAGSFSGRADAQMQEAVAGTGVLTDLQEIYQAAIDGRADLLIVHESFAQPVMMKDERTFDFIDDPTVPGAIDDIVSVIAWEVVAKGGRSVFTQQDQFKSLGKIALKPRY